MPARVLAALSDAAARAIRDALGVDADPDVRETSDPRFGDYQINGVLRLAKPLGDKPRNLAEKVAAALDTGGMCRDVEVAGPGFVNLRLDPDWVAERVRGAASDPNLELPAADRAETVVLDFSSPNVAKRMHVGHLRSTIIGDALQRTLRYRGHHVVGDNHVGDWGTQFGILIRAWRIHPEVATEDALERDPVGTLEHLYQLGKQDADADPSEAEAARAELARLQEGDPDNLELWRRLVAISNAEAERIYQRLGVRFDTWLGESAYHDRLPQVVEALEQRGLAQQGEAARDGGHPLLVFFPDDDRLGDKPAMVRKSDGAYLYLTTDLATLQYRRERWSPDRVVYVVDVRQSLHFEQLFAVAQRLGWGAPASEAPGDGSVTRLEHVGFGMMLGADGRPFRTREGGTYTLEALLDEARERIRPIVRDKWPDASAAEQEDIAERVGQGAVKFADLAQNLATDYRFDWDKLLAADGKTGPYLQYTFVRIRSVFRQHTERFGAEAEAARPERLRLDDDAEHALAYHLVGFGDVLEQLERQLRPHVLCDWLYELARRFNAFYAGCPILTDDEEARRSRLTLSRATERALTIGFDCLNLPLVERM